MLAVALSLLPIIERAAIPSAKGPSAPAAMPSPEAHAPFAIMAPAAVKPPVMPDPTRVFIKPVAKVPPNAEIPAASVPTPVIALAAPAALAAPLNPIAPAMPCDTGLTMALMTGRSTMVLNMLTTVSRMFSAKPLPLSNPRIRASVMLSLILSAVFCHSAATFFAASAPACCASTLPSAAALRFLAAMSASSLVVSSVHWLMLVF